MFTLAHLRIRRIFPSLAIAWTLLIPTGCFDLNLESYLLWGEGEVMITSGDPVPFHANTTLERVEDYDKDPMPKTLTLELGSRGGGDMTGTLVLKLDKGPSEVGRREVKGARLKLKGHPEVVLPADGWAWTGAFEVRLMQKFKLPDKDDRMCMDTYPTRTARVYFSLDAIGPAGQRYTEHPAEMDLKWSFVCEEFHM